MVDYNQIAKEPVGPLRQSANFLKTTLDDVDIIASQRRFLSEAKKTTRRRSF